MFVACAVRPLDRRALQGYSRKVFQGRRTDARRFISSCISSTRRFCMDGALPVLWPMGIGGRAVAAASMVGGHRAMPRRMLSPPHNRFGPPACATHVPAGRTRERKEGKKKGFQLWGSRTRRGLGRSPRRWIRPLPGVAVASSAGNCYITARCCAQRSGHVGEPMRFRAKTMATGWENHGNGRAERGPCLLWSVWRAWRVACVVCGVGVRLVCGQ